MLLAPAACGSSGDDDDDQADAAPGVDAAPGTADAGGDYYLPTGYTLTPFLSTDAQHNFPAALMVLEANKDYLAVIETDVGMMVLDLHEGDTPITVNSFVWLALHHYFDGIAFHRVIDGFMAQTGDPNTISGPVNTWGSGGPGYMGAVP